MIVCHCQQISDHDINAAIDWMRASDDKTIITPGKVYRALGKAADCGGCMPLFLSTMRTNDNVEVPPIQPMQPPVLTGIATQEDPHERRQESNSVSQRRTAK
ncbi:(2Fe-2S)-binding protein [Pseudopelagicola sp. nBUS_19]|uniref:(2Fe-2S)-binding protein n=1 Tax=Pseudopelagicola sp. nBUS_19 TaxID=3395316 RepID=UPI003EB9E5B7